jgi:hypothetical protein
MVVEDSKDESNIFSEGGEKGEEKKIIKQGF